MLIATGGLFSWQLLPDIMQSYALTVDKFLDHAAKWSGKREIVSASAGEAVSRIGYAKLRDRSKCASGALMSLGLAFGNRVGTLAWNTQHHLEVYYATMGVGLICHTLNPRLTPAHLADMINEADDRVLAVSVDLMTLLAGIAPLCPRLEHVIILDGAPSSPPPALAARVWAYESLLATRGAPMAWGQFDEEAPAGLCYTSGTTGKPKGVLYTHRANYLHTLRQLQADAAALLQAMSSWSPCRCFTPTAGDCRSPLRPLAQRSFCRADTPTARASQN